MKKYLSFLFSTRLMAILFLLFATSMAIATFIENDFGTPTARVVVYNAWWFEAIMGIFVINFLGNIFKFKLLRPKKWLTLLFHLSFILILVGAFITRYISYEGMFIAKEGETSAQILSQNTYLQLHVNNGEVQRELDKKVEFSTLYPKFFNDFTWKTDFKGQAVSVQYVDFIPKAETQFVEDDKGEKYLHFVESSAGSRTDHYIKEGEFKVINRTSVGFNQKAKQGINITENNGELFLESAEDGSFYRMADQFQGAVHKDSVQSLKLLSLYTLQGLQFVVPTLAKKGVQKVQTGEGTEDELIVDVSTNNETKRLHLRGSQYLVNAPAFFSLGGLNFRMHYGSKVIDLPFSITLRDFQLEKYPGSESPKSYASEVTVKDQNKIFDFRIFMNNILNYKGYKFFQSSYNVTPEYEETHLSVNHDFWGTTITYIGYFLLYFGLVMILFVPGSRFVELGKILNKIKKKKETLSVLFLLGASMSFAQHKAFDVNVDSLLKEYTTTVEQAERFSRIIIQEDNGRMQPFNTFSSQLIRKLNKKDHYKGYTADQLSLSMLINPRVWYAVPIIYLEKKNKKVRDMLGIPHEQRNARLVDFFDRNGSYKLKKEVEAAHKKNIRSQYEKDIINIDKRSNLLYAALGGDLFRFFPKPNDEAHKWYAATQVPYAGFTGMDSVAAASVVKLYAMELMTAKETNDYTKANKILDGIHRFQEQYGGKVMPTKKQVDFEIMYNKYDVFKNLFKYLMLASTFLFIITLIQLFSKWKVTDYIAKLAIAIIVGLFLAHTAGLGVRWYIGGYAPWSNAYESMIYVSWATLFFGLILGRKSTMTLASAGFVTSMMLMIAHWNWMDPAIGTLVPVLNSYWLMIHVAIIVASYGPFAVAMITGFISLCFIIFTTKKNFKIMKLNVEELSTITEMALTLGLIMLTIGNFLGGQWANESWGRYWGWDPKETWALISIMVYAFVIHARFVPGLKNKWIFNVFSVFAFYSILMTYFGVNHLLSGLHSYAAGEAAPIPNQIWGSLVVVSLVSIVSYFQFRKFYLSKKGK